MGLAEGSAGDVLRAHGECGARTAVVAHWAKDKNPA